MAITIKINNVDRTKDVDARTLSIRDELTSKVNTASFDLICNDVAVAPKAGEEVLIEGIDSTSQYPPEQSDTYVKATTFFSISYKPYFATDPTKLLTGSWYDNAWISNDLNPQRFHIDLGSAKVIKRIYYENTHSSGSFTERGVKNFTLWGSNIGTSFAELTYGTDTGWTQLTTSQDTFDQHVASDQADPKYITVTNATAYRYYAFKFADSHGGDYNIGVRRIELQSTTKLFSGRVLSKQESFLPPNLLTYPVECVDHTRDLDKKLVYQMHYKNQKAGDIFKFIILYYTDGFTYNNVSDGPVISDISFDYMQASEVFTKIAEICNYEWYVDYDKDVHFFARNTYPAPFQLDDNQANYKDLIINTDISQLRNRIYVKSSGLKDTFGEVFIYDGAATEWTCKFAPIYKERVKLPNINLYLVANQGVWNTDFSHDDVYLAIAYERYLGKGKGIILLKRTDDDLAKINDPDVTPNADGHDVTFSSDSTYLAIVSDVSPYVIIYKRDEDTFTKLTNPAILPTGTGWSCDFSLDDIYLAVAHATSPFITIYKRSGDIFTKLDNPVDLPPDTGIGAKFSPSGDYLVVTHDTTPFITIYKRSGDTFTKLDNPASLPTGSGNTAAWTPDSLYLAIGHNTSPYITVYKRAGDVFTKLDNPATLPTGTCCGVDWSPDGINLAVAHENTPFVTIYIRSGDTLNKQDDPIDLPAGLAKGATYSHNGKYLVIGCFTRPQLTIYKQFSPTIKVNGVTKTIGWDGVDNPLYFDFMLNEQTRVLSLGAAGGEMIDVGTLVSGSEVVAYPNTTHINKTNPANATGKVTRIEIYAYANLSNCKVATFYRPDPAGFPNNLSTRDTEYIGTVVSGSKQIFEVDLDVVEGDYIGIYFTAGYLCAAEPGYSGRWYSSGQDKIPCTNQTFEASITSDTCSIYGTGSIGSGELAVGSEILIGYSVSGVSICFKREDQDSIDIIKALEGGDGIIEFCLVDNNIDSIAWANEAAKADLLKNANSAIKATFITNRSDIRSGQIITLNSTKRNINQQFIVQKVELVRVDVLLLLSDMANIPYKPAATATIGYQPAAEAEIGYKSVVGTETIETIYYVFNVTIANKYRKLEDLFLYLLSRSDESLK